MEFFVYSRAMIEAITPHEVGHLIISIRTPGDPKEVRLPTNALTRGVLHLQFHDIDSYPADVEEILFAEEPHLKKAVFTDEMADQVLDFIDKHFTFAAYPVERIIVHCDAGISRSAAVAAALCKSVFADDDDPFFRRYHPNRRVYRAILNAYARMNEPP